MSNTSTVVNWPIILKTIGALLLLVSVAMVFPLLVAIYYDDGGKESFLYSITITCLIGSLMFYSERDALTANVRRRAAFLLVTLAWVSATICGALPYYLSGTYPTLIDAWFESASGFTTTGATVLSHIEGLPPSILLWRSLTQFLGGMGIIVLSLAVLPILGVGGMELYRAEAPGPTSDKISSRVSETARALWLVYLFLAIVETVLLWLLGMSFFDAVNHAFTTMATGGFSTKNASVAAFESPAIEYVITVFMFLAGANFLLHYRLLLRGDTGLFKDREFRFYTTIVLGAILLLTASLWGSQYDALSDAFRYSSFQVVSLITTTGYATADYLPWGAFAQLLLLSLMVVGGCAGSTAGGIKCVRAIMLIKQGYRELQQMVHPKGIIPLKVGKTPIPAHVTSSIFGFFFLYMLLLAVTSLVICAAGVDVITAISATISSLSNVGPGLGEVGPVLNYGGLPDIAKVLLSSCMIIGRLEIMTVLVLFTTEYWSS